ncbi:serine/threonine protein kinase [Ceratocystis pirilliformis]|uniref:Serine/threonine protein kinase n=1 Tax=Ceratocystis pirilliformis TaxID=259994 RepID=A0ABR3ZE32_9PEZI
MAIDDHISVSGHSCSQSSHSQSHIQNQPPSLSQPHGQPEKPDADLDPARASLLPPLQLPKNRSTGSLLRIAATATATASVSSPVSSASLASTSISASTLDGGGLDRSRLRHSADATAELESASRSPIIAQHDQHGFSALRRIRQQHSVRTYAHPSAPPSRSPSLAAIRSASMQISLPGPSNGNGPGPGPNSPLFLEDLSRFPSESLHSFSFAQTDENRQTSHRGLRWMTGEDSDSSRSAHAHLSHDHLHGSSSMVDLRDVNKPSLIDRGFGFAFGPRTASPERIALDSHATLASQVIPEDFEVSPETSHQQDASSPSVSSKSPKAIDDSSSNSDPSPRPTIAPARPSFLKRTLTDVLPSIVPSKVPASEQTFLEKQPTADGLETSSPILSAFPSRTMSSVHGHNTRWVPAAQAIFTTEAKPPWTILSANDLACLLFGVTKTEIRKIGILEVVQEERRAWLEKKLRYLDPAEAEKDETTRLNAPTAAAAAASALIGTQSGIASRLMGAPGSIMPTGTKASRRAQTVHNGDPNPPRTRTATHHRNNLSRGVLLCGDVVPIQKRNGITGSASIWVKEKRVGLIWVVEEIHEDSAIITLNASGTIEKVTGACQTVWGTESIKPGMPANVLIPRIPRQGIDPREGPIDYAQIARRRFYTCPYSNKVNIPCTVEQVRGSLELRVSSFPHMAGIIVISPETLTVKSTNSVFCGSLFGWEKPDGKPISSLVTNFDKLLKILTEEDGVDLAPGLVIPETSFRKASALLALREHQPDASNAFLYPMGIPAKHRDGSELKVDVQMRIIQGEKQVNGVRSGSLEEVDEEDEVLSMSPTTKPQQAVETVYALWVTYSRHLHCSQVPHEHGTPPVVATMSPLHQPSPGQLESRSPVDMHSDSDEPIEPKQPSPKALPSIVPPLSLDGKTETTTTSKPVPTESKPITYIKPDADSASEAKERITVSEASKKELADGSTTGTTTTATAPSDHKPGTRVKAHISDYTILEDMGQGAYGQVKLARHNTTGRKAVLKYVTKRRILVDTWTRDRRLGTVPLEIHVMSYLRRPEYEHPNIVEMECFFEDNENYYIEMVPHGLPGMDLFDYIELRAANMPEAECRSIFLQVARAVDHLHNVAKVVHRDIKDENMILDGKGVIKLIDFGSAAYIKSGPFNVFVGTIDYAAPEVLAGKPYNGKEQDVWALGILLYTIIYKENPFYTIDEIIDHDLRVPYVVSDDSIDLIRHMLDRNVEERFTIDHVLEHPWIKQAIEEERAAGSM